MSTSQSSLVVAEKSASYHSQSPQEQWIEVLVDCSGVQGLFTYRIPSDLVVNPGDILSVPFSTQVIGGIAIRFATSLPPDLDLNSIREVEEVITVGFFPPSYWQLLNQIADYYKTELITVIRCALPPGLLEQSQLRLRLKQELIPPGAEVFCSLTAQQILRLLKGQKDGDYSAKYLREKIRGADRGIRELIKRGWLEKYFQRTHSIKPKTKLAVILTSSDSFLELNKRQKEILKMLDNSGGEMWLDEFCNDFKTTPETLKKLAEKGCLIIENREILRLERGRGDVYDQAKTLNLSQKNALNILNSLKDFSQILLHGITGSGKTEVYLQAIAPILNQGKSVLILVPEIGLTPQLTDRFKARFGNKVCVYHSGLSAGERYDTWRQMLAGEPQVVIGTRSAIFAPLPKLGLIVLDEEHDSSFKQTQLIPTYHARTVAKWRAKLEDCPLILGSATPSLETWISATEGNSNSYYLSLPERINSRPLPPVKIVDMRQELKQGNRSIFSRSLQNALDNLQAEKRQAILFINRRGHSTFVSCRNCGYVLECPDCDVSLSYHYTHEGATELLRCHYCNYTTLQPRHCPECSSPYLKFFGSGTQKVTQELTREFPHLRWLRFDSDTTRTKDAHRTLLTQFTRGEADVLVGTQMLTKGLDIEQVTLVGVVAADGLLHLSDYRAAERAFQTLTQVAGRAGRGDEPGKVIIQTYSPEHPVIQAVRNHDYHNFIDTELPQREALNYPPYGRLILIRLSGMDEAEVQNTVEILADACTHLVSSDCEILGPAPANIMRVARRFRWHILLKFTSELVKSPDLQELRSLVPKSVSMTIDVDPLGLD